MTDAVRYDRDAGGVVTLTFDQPGQSANVMNADYMTAMGVAVDRLERDRDAGELRGVVLTSAKPTFFAGGDLEMLRDVDRGDLAEFRGFLTNVKTQLRRLERLGRPVVAAINGSALGGGLEIALACHHRVALDDPAVRVGFPEVTLGLLPGAGGIVRSVRLLGLTAALPLLVEGTQLGPGAAVKAGLVDELAATPEDLLTRARAWIEARAAEPEGPVQPWDRKGFRVPGQPADAQGYAALSAAPAMLTSRTHGAYPAPERILAAAVEGSFVDVDTALEIETRYFCDLVTGQVAKNMIGTLWFGRNEVARGASKPPGYEKRPVRTLGVLGAGMMGAGIAHVSAYAGIDVVLADVTADQARAGRDRIAALLDERVAKGRLTPGRRDEVLSRITVTDTGPGMAGPSGLADCDLVVEAVFEDRAVKNAVHAAAERAAPRAFLASNTSTLPITGLAEAVRAPDRFVGLHFFSPVHRMPLVEIIRGVQTSPVTLAAAFDFVRQIGKLPIIVDDGRGFFTSRVFGTYVTEGIAMVVEGVPPAVVENTARTAGFPVGPLAVADEVSLTLLARVRAQEVADLAAEGRTPAPHPAYDVIDAMVGELNRPGKGGGAGFYDYGGDEGKRLWPELAERFATGPGEVPVGDVADRLLFVQALEALRCLNEGVVQTARDANVGTVFGIGFPAWTGGAAQFVSAYGGPAVFTARAKELMARYGDRFQPPPIKW
ncbi:3-hydroxyacyl-CoA dehydrogenase / enoyl-CoA hydratase / 3-hydroxybutyryl-CoA epimerase [Actinopolymorpha cephalotaxi]|uniref:3-hydroxyacyl-CoA dehydrogenase / enoyl-CoA hydratase / 3-hydroxybutyryl-CoA epimerase n=1 Tax=Actinopolymorpha cephalotaxi TaxID=504797 RepID=A0A1I3BJI8_9ACTN|nr:3-hydroxyacyl-CoA dehydrogenase NAD-binding domain-containing protein [Actinopolymorpha cephalotaxi]NYH86408.1 3-hydroxyacyl-CoA dehydrogenase/enoyl-CoA hydratase/3-hydroxybutyryl-CoA epimerase [Actinopolymorpha cephalotaxi]SFH62089.1 3-hydroxyacyl-CoA dehydrogenase / enoyl-CoA hydratase / 3-hydroxybutyryl-CoA epimerase [Actinopolymorpha cephalotaxi]